MTDIAPSRLPPLSLVWGVLLVIGIAWGSTMTLARITVSTGQPVLGITLVSTLIGALILTAVLAVRGQRLPFTRGHVIFFVLCGFLGTALPGALSYTAARHLPAGIVSIVISLVPMATWCLALPLGIERFRWLRLAGLGLGLGAVLLLAIPDASLPDPEQAVWIVLPVLVALSYAGENVYLALAQPRDCDPVQTLAGFSWAAVAMLLPVVVVTETWMTVTTFGPAEQALVLMATLHVVCYSGFIWLVARAGPVFAAQVGYVVTVSGVLWGMAVLGERHSVYVWIALGLMLGGLALVRPRR